MSRSARLFVLAAGHGINDFIAGYLLGLVAAQLLPPVQLAGCFLVYNILAFGGQYGAAFLLKSFLNCRWALTLTWVLNILALAVFALSPQLAFVFAGCGSALYHVAGGSWVASQHKAAPIGLFAAPGVVGLVTAGYAAWAGADLELFLLSIAIVFGMISYRSDWSVSVTPAASMPDQTGSVVDKHDLFMILLLAAIALRSAVWNVFQMLHEGQYEWLVTIAVSAFVGKVAGGWLSDKIGWRLYSLLSLSAAAPLISFFSKEIVLFCIGIALLQSGIPANTALFVQHMQQEREKAVAYSFGVAVVAGGGLSFILWWFQLPESGVFITALLAVSAVLLVKNTVVLFRKFKT